jgi:hypothetical protein
MATVKEHLRKVHETFAEHHRAMSKHHSAAMGKESDRRNFIRQLQPRTMPLQTPTSRCAMNARRPLKAI